MMKKTNKLVLELERVLHELHECINEDNVYVHKVKGYTDYMSHIANAMLITSQIKLQKNRIKHER